MTQAPLGPDRDRGHPQRADRRRGGDGRDGLAHQPLAPSCASCSTTRPPSSTRDGNNVAQSARIPQPPQLDVALPARAARQVHRRANLGGRRRRHHQRSLLRRPAPAGHPRLPAGLRTRRGASPSSARSATTSMSAASPPAATAPSAIEIFQEGLRIPPVKLIEHGVLNEGVLAMMRQNVRQPDLLLGRPAGADRLARRSGAATCGGSRRATARDACSRPAPRILDTREAAMRADDRPHAGRALRVRGWHRR